MKLPRPLIAYFVILIALCAGFIIGARSLGQQGAYLAGAYMLSPALAALITRLLFHKPHFRDAYLRFGRLRDYIRFWLYALAITVVSFLAFTLVGGMRWDFSGKVFLDALTQQFAMQGQDMAASLPPGLSPQLLLWLYFIGGLTIFNVLPGIISGFGEEFGHRGLMFTQLLPQRPLIGLIIGGLLWYAWHLPLLLVLPPAPASPLWQTAVTHLAGAVGAVCTHTYLCYVLAKSRSIFVGSIAHIALNNAARSFAYFAVIQDQFAANLAQYLVMVLVIVVLFFRRELTFIPQFLAGSEAHQAKSSTAVPPS